jgi:RNA polymerase sigma factor (sigma-70 family)
MSTAYLGGVVCYLKRVALTSDRAQISDGELLTRYCEHKDTVAFEALVRRHGPVVLAVCRQVLGSVHDAEDAFQATFLVLMHKAGSLANREVVSSWLYRTAYYTARNARLSIARRRLYERKAANMAIAATTERTYSATELQPLFEEIARLPDKLRTPLTLCEIQGKSRAQAALLLGCPEGTLSSRLARGRALLRTRLERRGYQVPVAALAAAGTRETLRASLATTLVGSTVRTVAAWSCGDVVGAGKMSGQAFALAKLVLNGLTANKVQTWVLCLVSFACVGGASLMAQRELFATGGVHSPIGPPRQQEKPGANLQGDPLPRGAIARLGTGRMRPGNDVTALAFSPDGTLLACGPIYTNVVQVWHRASGRLLLECSGHQGTIMQLRFTSDGRTLISSSLDKTLRVWDAATGKQRFQLATPWPGQFAVSADNRYLAHSSADRTIHLTDLSSGKHIRTFRVGIEATIREGFEPIALVISPDGKQLATAEQKTLRLWDVETGRLRSTTESPNGGQPQAAAYSGGSIVVVSGAYGAPYTLWAFSEPAGPKTLRVEPGKVAQIAFAPDGGSLLFATQGGPLRLLDSGTGAELRVFTGMHGDARALAFSWDAKVAAAGTSHATLHQWDVVSGKEIDTTGKKAAAVDGVAFAPDGGTVATTNADGLLQMWDAASGRLRWQWQGARPKGSASLTISPDGSKVAVGGCGEGVSIIDLASGKQLARLLNERQVGVIGFSQDGEALVIFHQGNAVGWLDLKTGRERSRFPDLPAGGFEQPILARFGFDAHRFHAPCAAASPDGRLAALGDQDKLKCLAVDGAGKAMLLFESPVDSVACLAFAPNAQQLASAGDNAFVLIWDVASGKVVRQLDTRSQEIRSLAFSPDGKTLAAGTVRGELILLDTATGKPISRRAGQRGAILQIKFSADGKLLVTAGGADATALIWDLAQMRE